MSKKTQRGLLPFHQRVHGLIEELGEESFVDPEIGEDLRELIKRWRETILDPNSSEWVKKQNRANLRKIGISLSKPESPKKGRPTKTYEHEGLIWEAWIEIEARNMLVQYRALRNDGKSKEEAREEVINEFLDILERPSFKDLMSPERIDKIRNRLETFSWQNQRVDGFRTRVLAAILDTTPGSLKSTKSRRKPKR